MHALILSSQKFFKKVSMNQYASDNGSNLKSVPQSKWSAEGSNRPINSTGELVLLIPRPATDVTSCAC